MTPSQIFSDEFLKIFLNKLLAEHLQLTASINNGKIYFAYLKVGSLFNPQQRKCNSTTASRFILVLYVSVVMLNSLYIIGFTYIKTLRNCSYKRKAVVFLLGS